VLLKRKMLIDAGWPREALLITVVRDKKGEGHAVLTVKTDKGEFVLDNRMRASWPGPRPATASSSVSRRAIPMCGSRSVTTAPAVATASSRDR
jgi:predicted transglutaminase-like cysteine proteinase